jgi:hypothetical protein
VTAAPGTGPAVVVAGDALVDLTPTGGGGIAEPKGQLQRDRART